MSVENEESSKKTSGIDSFRKFAKNQQIKIGLMMPDMDKEVMLKVIDQFPEYRKFGNKGLKKLTKMHEATLKSSEKSQAYFFKGNKEYREIIRERLSRDDLDPEERNSLYEKLEKSIEKDSIKDTEHKTLLREALMIGGSGIVAALAIGVVLLGGKAAIQGLDGSDNSEGS